VEWALERMDCPFLPCLSKVWVMARIWSLTSASSSILVWRCSKIRGSIIPALEAIVVGRGSRVSGFERAELELSQNFDLGSRFAAVAVFFTSRSHGGCTFKVSFQAQMVFDIEIMLRVPSLPLSYSRLAVCQPLLGHSVTVIFSQDMNGSFVKFLKFDLLADFSNSR
jgi:hypothetical protein